MSKQIAKHIDGKADFAREMAKNKPHDAEWWAYIAELFDTTADEVRIGLLTEKRDVA